MVPHCNWFAHLWEGQDIEFQSITALHTNTKYKYQVFSFFGVLHLRASEDSWLENHNPGSFILHVPVDRRVTGAIGDN